jgi:hypothetical protein
MSFSEAKKLQRVAAWHVSTWQTGMGKAVLRIDDGLVIHTRRLDSYSPRTLRLQNHGTLYRKPVKFQTTETRLSSHNRNTINSWRSLDAETSDDQWEPNNLEIGSNRSSVVGPNGNISRRLGAIWETTKS